MFTYIYFSIAKVKWKKSESLYLFHYFFRFNLHLNWPTTFFILNLALTDLLYCVIVLPVYALQYFQKGWYLGKHFCIIIANFQLMNEFVCWMSVAMVGASRSITILNPGKLNFFSYRRNRFLIVIFNWIYGFILLIPTFEVCMNFQIKAHLS